MFLLFLGVIALYKISVLLLLFYLTDFSRSCPRSPALLLVVLATTVASQAVEWIRVEGNLSQVSMGPAGVWGVNGADIFYRTYTYQKPCSHGNDWSPIGGEKLITHRRLAAHPFGGQNVK